MTRTLTTVFSRPTHFFHSKIPSHSTNSPLLSQISGKTQPNFVTGSNNYGLEMTSPSFLPRLYIVHGYITVDFLQVERQAWQQSLYYINQLQHMADGASLKSWGRINTTQSQMFYELVLNNQQYLIKYYNETGKLKFIRPIKFPTQSVQYHSAGSYLLCYLDGSGKEYKSEIFLLKLTNCQMPVRSCLIHLDCKQNNRKAITTIYHNEALQIIIFADQLNNIYSLRFEEDVLKCTKIYTSNRKISRIQLDPQENIVLITQEKKTKVLNYNWEEETIENEYDILYQAEYYFQNGIEVTLTDDDAKHLSIEQQKQLNNRADKDYVLRVNAGGATYNYIFKKNVDLIFFSSKNTLLIIDKENNVTLQLLNQMVNVYGIHQYDRCLPVKLQQNNFLVNFRVDKTQNIKLELFIYDETKSTFNKFACTSLEKGKKMPCFSFFKKNLQRIFHINGLIDPLYEQTVYQALKQQQEDSVDLQRVVYRNIQSRQVIQGQLIIDPLGLAEVLLKRGLQYFPQQMNKIILKIKNHIINVSSTYCIHQAKRFFEYCEEIHNQIVSQVSQIYARIDQASFKSQIKSSVQMKDENFLKKTTVLLSNTVNFLTLMLNELTIEYEMIKQRKQQHQTQHNKIIQKNMRYYRDVLNSSKSIFLVVQLIVDEDTKLKYHQRFRDIAQKKNKLLKVWQNKYPSQSKMKYPALFLHEHFKSTSDWTSKKPGFSQFFSYLLQNRQNFFQVAYFYQLITTVPAVPYLESDISDLFQNIITHLQIIPELNQGRQRSKNRDTDLLYKMASTVLKMKEYSFIKYLIQLAITYEVYPLAVSLIFSDSFNLTNLDLCDEREHIFMVKSLLLCGKFQQAYLYVIRNHSNELFQQFVKWSKMNEKIIDLLQFKLERKYLEEDDRQVVKLLELPQAKQKFVQELLKDLNEQQA